MKASILKQLVFNFIVLTASLEVTAQSLSDFQNAINNSEKGVQAKHKYPPNIEDGKCHNVKITSITTTANEIKILESWTDYKNDPATTVLNGILEGDVAKGNWESSYSAGSWSYNFKTNSGMWNKTKAPPIFGKPFKKMEYLTFEVTDKNKLKDGFFKCE